MPEGLSAYELSATLYNVAYNAEKDAFTGRVIVQTFERTGVWPFNPDKILENACKNAGLESKKSKAAHVQAMKRSVEGMLSKDAKSQL